MTQAMIPVRNPIFHRETASAPVIIAHTASSTPDSTSTTQHIGTTVPETLDDAATI